jgi:hypothetical protein
VARATARWLGLVWTSRSRVVSFSGGNAEAEELTRKLEAGAAEMSQIMKRFGADRPDWDPLEKVLPLEHCAGFMFMGYPGEIRLYKHGFTRHYLNVDPKGNTYWYNERLDS